MDAAQIQKVLDEKMQLLEKKPDHFALLGVERKVSPEALKAAYFALAKVLHPDRLTRAGITDKGKEAHQVFRAISIAYETLSSRAARGEYVAKLERIEGGEEVGEAEDGQKGQDVRIFVHRGDSALKRRAYDDAESFFERALEAGGDDPKVHLKLGEAVFHNASHSESERLEGARKHWEKARDLSDDQADALYHLALYWKAKGNLDKMEELLRDVLTLKPKYVEAARELRLIKMRRRDARNQGLFGKLKSLTRKLKKKKK